MKPYQTIPILECGEPLVPIPLEQFAVESPHPYEKIGAPYTGTSPYYLRQSVLTALCSAQSQLQQQYPGWRIQIFDAYRPVAVQQFMVDHTFTEVVQAQKLNPATLSEAQRAAIWQEVYQIWAAPSSNPMTPPPHSTGAAVDLTLVDAKGKPIDMGSAIDELSCRSHPDYYANQPEQPYHQHRQLLRDVMYSAGFRRHPGEWWHFCLGDQMWAWLCNQEQPNTDFAARYGRVVMSLNANTIQPSAGKATFQTNALSVHIYHSSSTLAQEAARFVQNDLQGILHQQQTACVVLATGNSQIQFLEALIALGGVDWSRITLFHLDEYLGIDANHPASFRRYLRERVEQRVNPYKFHYIEGDTLEPLAECDRYTQLLLAQPIDLCCLGLGENGHLAFNEPSVADFNDPERVKLVKLDPATRLAQVDGGHFPSFEAVPQYAFTLTIPMICSAKKILCLVPAKRKAVAVKEMLFGTLSTSCPASILRTQAQATLFLDSDSASLLSFAQSDDGLA